MTIETERHKSALFVDLSNFYSRLIKSGLDTPQGLRNYFVEWFDFSVLSKMLMGISSDVWIFYSGQKLGSSDSKVVDKDLTDLISRINSQKGVSAYNANISGQQREPYTFTCQNCSHENEGTWKSEKGIDSSLIVHLFDTMESWNKAYLLSGDADFVPAVKSLRRRGKIVIGVGFSRSASSALKRECFEYIDLDDYISKDLIFYKLFSKTGLLERFFTELVPKNIPMFKQGGATSGDYFLSINLIYPAQSKNTYVIVNASDEINTTEWLGELRKLPLEVTVRGNNDFLITFEIHLLEYLKSTLISFAKRIELSGKTINDSAAYDAVGYEISFKWNESLKIYERQVNTN